MNAVMTYTRLLDDEELRVHLEQNDTLIFKGLGRQWQQVERQVVGLGFGDQFIVSQRGAKDSHTRVTPRQGL